VTVTAASIAVTRSCVVRPDASRVVTHLFVPGNEMAGGHESRASRVVQRILELDEEAVTKALDDVMQRFGGRHVGLRDTFRQHAARISNRVRAEADLSHDRWLLLGATFTHEYSVESVSACNPSIVPHPDQTALPDGAMRIVMSVRCIGEGHRSSIGFREGTIDANGTVAIDPPASCPVVGTPRPALLHRDVIHGHLRDASQDGESAAFALDQLPEVFTAQALEERLATLVAQGDTRRNVTATVDRLRSIASRSYQVDFPGDVELSRRILWPAVSAESHGMEDARFVRFVDSDGQVTYYATYTAYDGNAIREQLLATQDFVCFDSSSLAGAAAANKGLALFPRRIDGRFAALSRFDRETNSVALSDDPRIWSNAKIIQVPRRSWEVIQLGNCGPPIETPDGWLVLTHGVGPMRTYSVGALLLDLEDPTVVVGELSEPLLVPMADERDGYVPNVVYSCGGLLHGDTVVIPYGFADTAVAVATLRWSDLRHALLAS
jgi:predicted GH43/DUF377 family glycosyl hydrolase